MSREYEYGIRTKLGEMHRVFMNKEEAWDWIDAVETGAPVGAFVVVRRELGEWEDAD
jgi:hypothetical protein